jgi:hypothetical protein
VTAILFWIIYCTVQPWVITCLINVHVIIWHIYSYVYTLYMLGFSQSRIVTVDYALLKVAPVNHFNHFNSHMLDHHQV